MSKVNSDTVISIKVGCADFLVEEVERLRREREILAAENRVMNNFFALVNRIGDQPRQGFAEDKLWQAKREINAAKEKVSVELV